MQRVLDYEAITKVYGTKWSRQRVRALDEFTLSLEPGEIFGFLGPNGAGKTTAIHLALGFMSPSTGKGQLLGRPFGSAETRKRVGFLAENVALYHRPARKLLQFYGAVNGLRGSHLEKRCREALRQVELEHEGNRNVGKFSRGMQQRIGLAQALINNPELLILDEPTSALDPQARVAMRELLLEVNRAGTTVFLSSHLLSEIEMICHRVGILVKGRLVKVGRTAELLVSRDRYEIIVGGVSEERFPQAEVRNGHLVLTVPATSQREALEQVWSLGGQVLSVNPVRRTLEDVFLELTLGAAN